jgi:putative Ca2+/H+ antiporter (TMEM165/GDT1 family)
MKLFITIFMTILFAELGDKTQLATLLFAADGDNPKVLVFFASAAALVTASAIAVLLGKLLQSYVNPKYLAWIAGAGFIFIGAWTIIKA